MYLKSLEIHGFKSFADKTKFEFHPGVTGIVGPNGCGKSNVVDAIRWVLGETSAKALRGGEMADVIFNGTEKRKALGMAEVTMTMANCEELLKVDFNELALTRRVYRDGKSEYRINNTLCRLRDIHDLLMDTGIGRTAYSIMAQGQIDQILSSKPEERRAVFEEAAGITKYKKEKKEAIRKLEFTEANLLRVSDVLAEQERRMSSLKRQVSKARRYLSLTADIRTLDTHLSYHRYVSIQNERHLYQQNIDAFINLEQQLTLRIPNQEEKVHEARTQVKHYEHRLQSLRQALNEHHASLSAAESRILFNNERKIELEERITTHQSTIESNVQKLSELENDYSLLEVTLIELVQQLSEQEAALGTQESLVNEHRVQKQSVEHFLRENRIECNRTQSLVSTLQAKLESSMVQIENHHERVHQLEQEKLSLNAQLQEVEAEKQQLEQQLEQAQQHVNQTHDSYIRLEQQVQEEQESASLVQSEVFQIEQQLAQRTARLTAMKQLVASGEGYEKGTQQVLAGLRDPEVFKKHIHGVIASFLEVESPCERALEAALGARLQTVLVSEIPIAEQIIQRLTEKKWGVASLLPATTIPQPVALTYPPLPDGAIAWATQRIQVKSEVASVVHKWLEKTLIVANLATAISLHKQYPDCTFVTLSGELLSQQSCLQGGATSDREASILERVNEIKQLQELVEQQEQLRLEALDKQTLIVQAVQQSRTDLDLAYETWQQAKVTISSLQGSQSLVQRELTSLTQKLERLQQETSELDHREARTRETIATIEQELTASRERLEAMEAEGRKFQNQLDSVAQDEQDQLNILNEIKMNVAVEQRSRLNIEEQRQPLELRLNDLRERNQAYQEEIQQFEHRITKMLVENEELAQSKETNVFEIQRSEDEIYDVESQRGSFIQDIEQQESLLDELRRDFAKNNEQKGHHEVSLTKLDLRLENLEMMIHERYQLKLADFSPDLQALHTSILSQKKLQNTQEKTTYVTTSLEDDAEEDEPPIVVIDGTREEEESPEIDESSEIDWNFIEAVVLDIKRRIDALGPVNMESIQEYEELEQRYLFLKTQHDDLVNAKSELLTVIEKINHETKRLFSDTFAQVKINFRMMFEALFGEKAEADLMLLDHDDPLESGIEVIAKPPGKKLQSITLLSGGERSMTAVALLFSIYMIKPSPFCVLDELDAPLDESNINRFVKMLDRFIDRSQFIIVTHSKRTMARADVMYGVTMEEFGVSKPVGMRLTQNDLFNEKAEPQSAAQKAAMRLDA